MGGCGPSGPPDSMEKALMSLPLSNKQLVRLAWAAGLRADEDRQCHGNDYLGSLSNPRHPVCALMHLMELVSKAQGISPVDIGDYLLTGVAQEHAGLSYRQAAQVIAMNDGGVPMPTGMELRRYSFAEIADWLEALPPATEDA